MIDQTPEGLLRAWAKAYRDRPEYRFPSDPDAEFFPVDLEYAANEIERLRNALKPFARPSIPPDLPDNLWTHCSTYEYDMPQATFDQLSAKGVELKSRKISLTLWIDGHPLSDFRRAREVLGLTRPVGTGKDPL